MASILDTILDHKRSVELPQRLREIPLSEMRRAAEQAAEQAAVQMSERSKDFIAALTRNDGCVALIAEVKRASPSKGELVKGKFEPVELAQTYETNGASAVSVLTDERFFRGALDHLRQVKQAVSIPVLRKDFLVDPYQLYEARAAGADAALLIVAALDDVTLADLHALACELGLTALVEVHDEHETERAMKIGARVIGVNNRDLRTFVTDIATTEKCARTIGCWLLVNEERQSTNDQQRIANSQYPILVSESGLFTSDDVARVAQMGAQAVLVGESIITSDDIPAQVQALSRVNSHPTSWQALALHSSAGHESR